MTPIPLARSINNIKPSSLRSQLLTPLHLKGLISHWPAFKLWTLSDNLRAIRDSVGENREVEVELGKRGRGYLDPSSQRVSMGFGLFLDAFILSLIPSSSSTADLPTAYLAQSDVLDNCPDLSSATPLLPHYDIGDEGNLYRRTLWLGRGSWTPFHKDPYIGIYSQIIGRKTFHILPPDAAKHLDLSPIPRYSNTSQIPIPVSRVFSPSPSARSTPGPHNDLSDLPPDALSKSRTSLEAAFALSGACQVNLEPGDSVLVPQGWWHAVEGEEGPGVGVGAWFR